MVGRLLLAAILMLSLNGCAVIGYFACHKYDPRQATTDCDG